MKNWSTGTKILVAILIIALIALIINWNKIFSAKSNVAEGLQERILDENGNFTGSYISVEDSASKFQLPCKKVTNNFGVSGWIGKCNFPIKK